MDFDPVSETKNESQHVQQEVSTPCIPLSSLVIGRDIGCIPRVPVGSLDINHFLVSPFRIA